MWMLLPLRVRLTAIVALSFALGYGMTIVRSDGIAVMQDDLALAMNVLSAVPVALAVGIGLGAMRWTWILPCRLGLAQWYPDINGIWLGKIKSTYSADLSQQQVDVVMRVQQKWTNIQISMENLAGDPISDTVEVIPNFEDHKPSVWMLYRGRNLLPQPTDVSTYLGSSHLTHQPVSNRLDGFYWTNRAWERGHNTAGSLQMKFYSRDTNTTLSQSEFDEVMRVD